MSRHASTTHGADRAGAGDADADAGAAAGAAPLRIRGLGVDYGRGPAVVGFDLDVAPGEIVGVIGESGSGKSTVAMAALGLLPSTATVTSDAFEVAGVEVDDLSESEWTVLRGSVASMVFQEPMTALNPSMTVGAQIVEALVLHGIASGAAAEAHAVELLESVHMPQPAARMRQFPFQLSGGQRQRVMIAIAMAASPRLLVADEPTTALDVTVQRRILDIIVELRDRTDMGVLLISHDLAVVSQLCSRVVVMYRGHVVESGLTRDVLAAPSHPYTKALLGSVLAGQQAPRTLLTTIDGEFATGPVDPDASQADLAVTLTERAPLPPARITPAEDDVLLRFDAVDKVYGTRAANRVQALDGVSLSVRRGETFGVVGESGSGKSTLSRLGTLIERPTAGRVLFDGEDITDLRGRAAARFRSRIQVVFQDPNDSLDPRFTVEQSVGEALRPLRLGREERRHRVTAALEQVGLPADAGRRRPHEFSGGQRQRIAIARAMVTKPEFVVLDEPTSALDVSVQAQILNLLLDLQLETGVTYLFISHNMAVVRHLAHRLAVMRAGRVVEVGDADQVFDAPTDDYTRALLDSIPTLEPTA